MAEEDTEITLGIGKLLGLFFMLAATCGIFFAVGYSLGKTAEREQALKNQPAQTAPADSDLATSQASGNSGSASKGPSAADEKQGDDNAPNLTFYKAVKQSPGGETKTAQGSPASIAGPEQKSGAAKLHEPTIAGTPVTKPTSSAKPDAASAGATTQTAGTFLVQVAAVTHEEDAAALAGALRKKSYSAAVVNNPSGKDKLYHVVLGPYASLQDAEAMKSKLQGEGYSPIVKR